MNQAYEGPIGARASRPHFSEVDPTGIRNHRAWHSRGYLPHFDGPGIIQFITFRLSDSMPTEVLAEWALDMSLEDQSHSGPESSEKRRMRIDQYLDQGHGSCWLSDDRVALIVKNALLQFDGERYRQLAWVIMPNHVHTMIEVFDGFPLDRVVHSWKSFTAKQANKILGRRGRFWSADYFDRFIRDDKHLSAVATYIEDNPVKALVWST